MRIKNAGWSATRQARVSAVSFKTFIWVTRDGFIYLDTLEHVLKESILVGLITVLFRDSDRKHCVPDVFSFCINNIALSVKKGKVKRARLKKLKKCSLCKSLVEFKIIWAFVCILYENNHLHSVMYLFVKIMYFLREIKI